MTQPAPKTGRIWNVIDYIHGNVAFATMIGTYGQPSGGPASPALDNLSVHYWHLKEIPDEQTPHKQDELYYVLEGAGTVTVSGVEQPLKSGDLLFVPRCAEHRFTDFEEEGLHLLVFFSPDFTG